MCRDIPSMQRHSCIPGHCLALQGFTETTRRRYIVQQPGTKSARGPADKPTFRIQNPDTQQAGRSARRSADGGAARRWAEPGADISVA